MFNVDARSLANHRVFVQGFDQVIYLQVYRIAIFSGLKNELNDCDAIPSFKIKVVAHVYCGQRPDAALGDVNAPGIATEVIGPYP